MSGSVADVSDVQQVERVFDDVRQRLAGLDVLVNNAGIAGPTAAVEDINPDDWARTLAVNITGQFLCARRAVPLLKAAGGGSIINLSSAAGRLGYPLRTPYAASKWAVIGFTSSLAMELGPHNIRVNALLPGLVHGERIRGVIAARAEAQGVAYDEMEQQYLDQVSLRRMVAPGDVAAMALFLCSEAGRNISGQSLGVCGNVEVLR
jgi:NAD(P)-dependent dehydrogenase (short-subunit alcohol dehydrogenase family)